MQYIHFIVITEKQLILSLAFLIEKLLKWSSLILVYKMEYVLNSQ